MRGRARSVELKSIDELSLMREAGLIVAKTLECVAQAVAPAVTTNELNEIARDCIRNHGASPSFLGYYGFPAVICTSVNDEVVHGIPGARALAEGDVISIDCGAIVEGWHGDAAITVLVEPVAEWIRVLSQVTESAMWSGLAQARNGNRISNIGHAVEGVARQAGSYGIVRDYVGHGIGSAMHMFPPVPNYGKPGSGPKIQPGMALAIEPMLTMGSESVIVREDQWTVATQDGSVAAHWEHTVAVTDDGPWVLTSIDGRRL